MSPPAGVVDGLLAGRYRLAHRLGSGATGEVWRARDERTDRDVAVKVLRPELAHDHQARSRVLAQARHAALLRSPGIAAVLDVAEEQGAWLVTELVDGEPLSAVLRREGRLPADRTLELVEQVAGALQVAHDAGVVHHHLTLDNVLLRRGGGLAVTDFGTAHAAGAALRTGQVVGAAPSPSPEQAAGRSVTAAPDLHALGVLAHECLSGRPLRRQDASPLPDDVPGPVADLVRDLLAGDPADRPPSAQQVRLEAATLRRDLPAATPATTPLPAATTGGTTPRAAVLGLGARPGQRRAVRVIAVALGLLALVLGVRDALDDDASSEGERQPRPTSSVPGGDTGSGG